MLILHIMNIIHRGEAGYILGAVGSSALAEVGQTPHLHFAVMADGICVNPLSYLA